MTPIEIKVSPLGIFIGYAATFLVCVVFGTIFFSGNNLLELQNIFIVLFGTFCAFMTFKNFVHRGVYMKIDERGIWHTDMQEYITWEDIEGYGRYFSNFRYWLHIITKKPVPWRQPALVSSFESVALKIIPGLKPIPRTSQVASLELYPFSNLSYSQITALLENKGVRFHE